MPAPSKPTTADYFLGHAFGSLKKFFDGFDSGAGVVKLRYYLTGIYTIVGAAYAPYVVSGGVIFGLLCVAKIIHEESVNNFIELEKINRLKKLHVQLASYHATTLQAIKQDILNSAEIKALARQWGKTKKEAEVTRLVQQEVQKKIAERYSDLLVFSRPTAEKNRAFLKVVLREYLNSFGPNPVMYRKPNGNYPSQDKIAKLIQNIENINAKSPDFHSKVADLLKDDPALQQQYKKMFPQQLLPEDQTFWSFCTQQINNFRAFFKRQRTLRHFVSNAVGFVTNLASGSGLSAGLLKLFGVITAGVPVSWPLLAVVAAGGLIYGGVNLAYNLGRNNVRLSNIKSLDKEIKHVENSLQLNTRLRKIHKNQEKLKYYRGLNAHKELHNPEKQVARVKASFPWSTYIRIGLGIFGNTIVAASSAMMTGFGMAWLGALLFPVLPIVAPTLIAGGALSGFYIFRTLKAEVKALKAEFALNQEVAEYKQLLREKYNSPEFKVDLAKDSRTLLETVIKQYITYIKNNGGDHFRNNKGRFPQQEKIMQHIENAVGMTRPIAENGKAARFGNDELYNRLAQYLQGNDKNNENTVAKELKELLVRPSDVDAKVGLTLAAPNANDPVINQKPGFFARTLKVLQEHGFVTVAAVSTAIMLPLFLGGPQAIIIAPVAAVIVGAFVIAKIASHYADKNRAALSDERNKCQLIERNYKLLGKMQRRQSAESVLHVEEDLSPAIDLAPRKEEVRSPLQALSGTATVRPVAPPSSVVLGKSMDDVWRRGSRQEEIQPNPAVPCRVEGAIALPVASKAEGCHEPSTIINVNTLVLAKV